MTKNLISSEVRAIFVLVCMEGKQYNPKYKYKYNSGMGSHM